MLYVQTLDLKTTKNTLHHYQQKARCFLFTYLHAAEYKKQIKICKTQIMLYHKLTLYHTFTTLYLCNIPVDFDKEELSIKCKHESLSGGL